MWVVGDGRWLGVAKVVGDGRWMEVVVGGGCWQVVVGSL